MTMKRKDSSLKETITMSQSSPTMPAGSTDLDFILSINSWQLHAASYKQAADTLVDAAMADSASIVRGDFLFPVAYLYRHYLELILKNIIHGGVSLGKITASNDLLAKHNLHKLWNKVSELLTIVCDASDQKAIQGAEALILQYHAVDESSCAFRYPERNDGSKFLAALPADGRLVTQLKSLNLAGPKGDIATVHEFLDDISGLLNAEFDSLTDEIP